jgi:hypothetical protein
MGSFQRGSREPWAKRMIERGTLGVGDVMSLPEDQPPESGQ